MARPPPALGEPQEERLELLRPPVQPEQLQARAHHHLRHPRPQLRRGLHPERHHPLRLARHVHRPHLRERRQHPLPLAPHLHLDEAPASQPLAQLRLGALRHQLPVLDDQEPITRLADLRQQVAGDEHGVLRPPQAPDERAHLHHLPGIQPTARLVEQEQRRPVDERLRHAHALPVAMAQRGDGRVVHVAQARLLLGLGDAGGHLARGHAAQPRHEGEELPHPHLVVERRRVREEADALAHLVRVAHHVVAVDDGPPRGGQQHAPENLQGGRLPRAVEPQEADDLAPLDAEGEAADGRVAAVVPGQPLDVDHLGVSLSRGGSAAPRSSFPG